MNTDPREGGAADRAGDPTGAPGSFGAAPPPPYGPPGRDPYRSARPAGPPGPRSPQPPPGPYPPGPYPPPAGASGPPRDPYERTVLDPQEMTVRDPGGRAARDPLEETMPDPVRRGMRLGRRRAIEAVALLAVGVGLLGMQWRDDSDQARSLDPGEHLTVVGHGRTGTLGHVQWRVLGRDATAAPRSTTTPAGAVRLKLIVEVRPLDAQGVKDAGAAVYFLRDREGHRWTGVADAPDPVAGRPAPATISADIPERLVSSVVLEVWRTSVARGPERTIEVLRFAH